MSEAAAGDRPFRCIDVQVRRKFKHASEFGVDGRFDQQRAVLFVAAMSAHVTDGETRAVPVRFGRGAGSGGFAAVCYVNERTGLAVVTTVDGTFVTGYRLSDGQLDHVLRHGKLGGGR